MHVFVTGATGFVGRALVQRLLGAGHRVGAWARDPSRARNQIGPQVELLPTGADDQALAERLSGVDAVVNLAGENVMGGRLTEARKHALWSSRVDLTRRLVKAMANAAPRPRVLLSASAVGYYGDRGDEALTEDSEAGQGYLAELCQAWEQAAWQARDVGARVAVMRIGIVLGQDGGMLASTLPIFRLGLGGPLGSGEQYVPFIHLDDLIEVLMRGLDDERVAGAFNATAPAPVTSAGFARELGKALRRPAVLPAPSLALRLVLGERARIVLQSQNAVPMRLQQLDHVFDHPTLDVALASIFASRRAVELGPATAADDASPLPHSSDGWPRGATHVLETRTLLDVPPEEAFEFFCRAENLGLITPGWLGFAFEGEPPTDIGEGTVIRYRIRLGPFPLRWRTVIARWQPPHRFVDNQDAGPYRLWWHEHRIEPRPGGSVMVDRVYYALPLGWLGRLVHGLTVAPTLRAIFAYRIEAIRRLFAAGEGRGSELPGEHRHVGDEGGEEQEPLAATHA
jgi:hypothetical protein